MHDALFCLMGPTASGKTALACELVTHFPFEIISIDSAMIYRGMDIGTAKPAEHELKLAPHHLINVIDPDESYSAAQCCADVLSLREAILARGKIPLLVGGTMMYFHALQKGLTALPEGNEAVRQRLEEEMRSQGLQALYHQLERVDPITAARIHSNDTQRVQRALEVYYLTGKPMSEILQVQVSKTSFQWINLILFPQNRVWLHDRIAERFDQMLEQGLIEEVMALQNKWPLHREMPSMRCVGYRQVLEYLQGHYDKAMLRDKGVIATRQLAKRQLTWLRHWDNGHYFDPEDSLLPEQMMNRLLKCYF